ncbi:MAG: hypothetical protein RL014_1884 [Pseudomonadota bacterium]|jgi:hypothetical protein
MTGQIFTTPTIFRGSEMDLAIAKQMTAEEFFTAVRPEDDAARRGCAARADNRGAPSIHMWPDDHVRTSSFLASKTAGQRGGYFTPANFYVTSEQRFRRTGAQVAAVKALWLDIEGAVTKGGYDGPVAVAAAMAKFVESAGLQPSLVVLTGSGGLHAYFVLDEELRLDQWRCLAAGLVAAADKHGLRIDSPVTRDPSRIMRAPGSIHAKTGRTVLAYRTGPIYSVGELSVALPGSAPGGAMAPETYVGDRDTSQANATTGYGKARHHPFSMLEAAKHCAALRNAMADKGAKTRYQPWVLALCTAKLSVEGTALGHAISEGHPRYRPGEVEYRMASFTGGPPSCESWHRAWGSASPCPECCAHEEMGR